MKFLISEFLYQGHAVIKGGIHVHAVPRVVSGLEINVCW